jgi:predicted aspartyl protease
MILNTILKRNTIYLLFLVFTFPSTAQNITLNKGNTKQENYYAEIPFEFVNGKIIIPVIIKNKTYRFLLDTGAPNCITSKLNNSINAQFIQQITVTDANSNKSIMNIVDLPELSIGNIVFQNTVALAYVEEKNLIFDCFKIDGFIGSNLLRNSVLQINLQKKIIIITNDIKKVETNKKEVSKITLIGNQSSPLVWINLIGNKSIKEQVLIDTGMAGFYDLSKRVYDSYKDKVDIKILATGSGSSDLSLFENTKIAEQMRLLVPEIKVSKTKFTNIITTTSSDNNSRIGIVLLQYGIGTLDYKNKKFYYSAFSRTNDLNEKLQPFSPTINNNKLSVGIVWDDNLKDKITNGDEIIEMNGINYEQYEICDLITKPSIFKNLTLTEIVVKKTNGSILKVKI